VRLTEKALTPEDLDALRLPRHAPHAAEIELPHPRDQRALRLAAPVPPDLARFFERDWGQAAQTEAA
jgi:hypothetical protein